MFQRTSESYLEKEGVGHSGHRWKKACASSDGSGELLKGLKEGKSKRRFAFQSNHSDYSVQKQVNGNKAKTRRAGGTKSGLPSTCSNPSEKS